MISSGFTRVRYDATTAIDNTNDSNSAPLLLIILYRNTDAPWNDISSSAKNRSVDLPIYQFLFDKSSHRRRSSKNLETPRRNSVCTALFTSLLLSIGPDHSEYWGESMYHGPTSRAGRFWPGVKGRPPLTVNVRTTCNVYCLLYTVKCTLISSNTDI